MSGDRDMQHLMAALPDALASVVLPRAQQLSNGSRSRSKHWRAPASRHPSTSTRPLHRWRGFDGGPRAAPLEPVAAPALIAFDALRNVERQVAIVERNTRQFVRGFAANHVLLTARAAPGSRRS